MIRATRLRLVASPSAARARCTRRAPYRAPLSAKWACPDLVDGWLVESGLSLIVHHRAEVAKGGVQTAAVVEAFDVLKQGCPGGSVVDEGGSVHQLVL